MNMLILILIIILILILININKCNEVEHFLIPKINETEPNPVYKTENQNGINLNNYKSIPIHEFGINSPLWKISILFMYKQGSAFSWQSIIGNMFNLDINNGWFLVINPDSRLNFVCFDNKNAMVNKILKFNNIKDSYNQSTDGKLEYNKIYQINIKYQNKYIEFELLYDMRLLENGEYYGTSTNENISISVVDSIIPSNKGFITIGGNYPNNNEHQFLGEIYAVSVINYLCEKVQMPFLEPKPIPSLKEVEAAAEDRKIKIKNAIKAAEDKAAADKAAADKAAADKAAADAAAKAAIKAAADKAAAIKAAEDKAAAVAKAAADKAADDAKKASGIVIIPYSSKEKIYFNENLINGVTILNLASDNFGLNLVAWKMSIVFDYIPSSETQIIIKSGNLTSRGWALYANTNSYLNFSIKFSPNTSLTIFDLNLRSSRNQHNDNLWGLLKIDTKYQVDISYNNRNFQFRIISKIEYDISTDKYSGIPTEINNESINNPLPLSFINTEPNTSILKFMGKINAISVVNNNPPETNVTIAFKPKIQISK